MQGNDVLIGSGGDDVLQGGAGHYDACDNEADTVAATGCEIRRKP